MIEDLLAASSLLSTAPKRYLATSSVIEGYCNAGHGLGSMPRESLNAFFGEIELSNVYNVQFQETRLNTIQTKNMIPTPIAILPFDILAQIFEEIVDMQPGYFECMETAKPFRVRYPETLTHVCSRWRRVALSLRPLWSRIDLHFDQGSRQAGALIRARSFSTRADPLPLNIHLFVPSYTSHENWYSGGKRDHLLAAIAPRMRSLHLSSSDSFGSHHSSILTTLFTNCMPGRLNEIDIDFLPETHGAIVIGSSESQDNYPDEKIGVPHGELDISLLPIKVLRSTGVCFHWNSRAYYGLVTLYLRSARQSPAITESQLSDILAASPGLRSLHLAYEPVVPLLNPAHCKTVCLNELETLSMGFMGVNAYRVVLRLISPGSKLQKLRLWMDSEGFQAVEHELRAFFARTSVKKLNIWLEGNGRFITPETFRLFRQLSGLKQLVLYRVSLTANKSARDPLPDNDLAPIHAGLSELRFDHSTFELNQLKRARELFPFQVLKLWNCCMRWGYGERLCTSQQAAQEIAKIFPAVEFIDEKNEPDVDTFGVWN